MSTLPILALLLAQPATTAASDRAAWRDAVRRESHARLEADATLRFDPTAVLVRFAATDTASRRSEIRSFVGDGLLETFPRDVELIHVRIPVEAALELLRPHVVTAEPDWVIRAASIPNDPLFAQQWGLRNTGQTVNSDTGTAGADIAADAAWDTTVGSASVTVAILDTGIQTSHMDLAPNLWVNSGETPGNFVDDDGNGWIDDVNGWDFYDGDNTPLDGDGHGTAMAGLVGARGNNAAGISGVAQQCRLMPVRFLGPGGAGTSSGLASGIYYAAGRNASGVGTWAGSKVLNCSTSGTSGAWTGMAVRDAIDWAGGNGRLFVGSAGNGGADISTGAHFPAAFALSNMLTVTATDNDDQLASFANWSATLVHLAAPGVNVYATDLTGTAGYSSVDYAFVSGTSAATCFVSGVAALVWSQNPGFTMAQVRERILTTTRALPALAGRTVTGGIVDAAEAVAPAPIAGFCAGDGTGTACPCNNSSAAGGGAGCASSLGSGALLAASGTPSITNDTLALHGSGMPDSSALYFQGTQLQSYGAGTLFGDGKRCAAGTVVRLKTVTNAGGASQYPQAGDPSVSVRGGVSFPGLRTYQIWYRNAAPFCTSATFNLSNGVRITWRLL